jgi:hypothetical protein
MTTKKITVFWDVAPCSLADICEKLSKNLFPEFSVQKSKPVTPLNPRILY